ncbi:MAG TPA: sulfite exporter TauE/SafE family protein [Vicinamibacterales bacterium]|nr:sulfite exporter TauE/SafE family protein [Vicinamibacterales bacterium]
MSSFEWLAAGTAVLAGAIAAVSGFGVGSLLTPVLMLSMPTTEAVAVLAIPHAVVTAVRLWRLRRDVDFETFRQFGVASAIGGLAGAFLQPHLSSRLLAGTLGALLLVSGTTEVLRRPVPLPRTPAFRLIGGTLSGVFGGLVGNQGGIRAAALLGFNLNPLQIVATATASAILVDAARVPIYLYYAGPAIAAKARLAALITTAALVGTYVGIKVLARLDQRVYRRLVGVLLLILGAWLLVQL